MSVNKSERLLVEQLYTTSVEKNQNGVEGKVKDLNKLTGDASTRRYYRILTTENAFVVCLDDPLPKGGESEFYLLQKVLRENNVRVPLIYDVDESKGYLLEEDLGDETLLKSLSMIASQQEEYQIYEKVVKEVIKIHSIDLKKYKGKVFTERSFDRKKLFEEVELTNKYFVEELMGHHLTRAESKELTKTFGDICDFLASQSMFLVHRDYHSRNLMVKNNDFVVIDFQDARLGTPLYDLVSLLEDCYYKINESNKERLKKFYWETFARPSSVCSSWENFLEIYDYMAIQRIYKAIGSFSYIYKTRGDERYLKYIGYAFENLRMFLKTSSKFDALRILLSRIYYDY